MRGGYGAKAAGRLSVFLALRMAAFFAPVLETSRLILRPQEEADSRALFAILGDPHAMRFWNRPAITRLAVVEELVREQQAAMTGGRCFYWTLMRSGEAIGSVDLSLIQDGSAELGFLLRRDRWGLGLASEAVAAVIAHGFSALQLLRLASVVQTANHAAARVLQKNGFTCVQSQPVLLASGRRADCDFYLRERD